MDSTQALRDDGVPTDSSAPVESAARNRSDDAERLHWEFLDVQREGLSAIRLLSRSVVGAAVGEIEERYRQACAAAEGELQDRLREIEGRTAAELAAIEHGRLTQAPPIQTGFEKAAADAAEKARITLEHTAAKSRDLEAEADLLLQHQYLLSDTVAQANCERLKKERLAFEQHTAEAYKHLDQLHAQIEAQMYRYGMEVPPIEPPAPAADAADAEDSGEYERQLQAVTEQLDALEHIRDGRVFVGAQMYVLLALFCGAVVIGFFVASRAGMSGAPPFLMYGPISLVSTIIFSIVFGFIMRRRERMRIWGTYEPLARAYASARQALDHRVSRKRERHQKLESRAAEILRNNPEKVAAKKKFDASIAEIKKKVSDARVSLQDALRRQQADIAQRRDSALGAIASETQQRIAQVRQLHDRDAGTARAAHDDYVRVAKERHDAQRAVLERGWHVEEEHIRRFLAAGDQLAIPTGSQWERHASSVSASGTAGLVSLGHWHFDWAQLAANVSGLARLRSGRPAQDASPTVLGQQNRFSLLLQTDRAGRQRAIDTIRAVMLRLLTTLRAGRVRFTIADPVGLGESFAGFMHLVDYQEALVGGRIWTDSDQIESRLIELTSHMENVIQKYLRNEFATIDAYNRQAGPLAEPYRFLVLADFPANFTEGAVRRLTSIINSGARCGVYTLIMHDRRLGLPSGMPLEDLAGNALHLVHDGERFVANDDLLRHFPLTLDDPPSEDELTRLMHEVGRGARDAFRVEVPFDAIVPSADQRWTQDAASQISIPIGHAGAVRFQNFILGRGLAQHALMAGKTGSGKSTLMHVIITNLALSYSPEELELYLVDFKKGVEFKTYVTHALPHARAIAIESDREFGVSVLQRLDAEMTRRGDLFRAAGVQDLPSYRAATGERMPRTLLIVDEFQVFFAEDDRLAQDASALLDRLVRQGRAFGIHLLLGSQTLAGSSGLARSTMGQMSVRVALQCSEADSQLILDDTNAAARLLSRPGEAIYNDAGGLVAGNNTFQVAWLSDERQSAFLDDVRSLADTRGWRGDPAIVFEGNALADLRQNRLAMRLIAAPNWPPATQSPQIWLGEPVAIKEPTGLTVRRQSGSNVLVVGQREDVAQSMLAGAMLCLGIQHAMQTAQFVILGGAADESPMSGGLRDVTAALPHSIRWTEWREVPEIIAELSAEVKRRIEQGPSHAPAVYVFVFGLQRYRVLRRREDSYSFAPSDSEAAPATDEQFAELLREGPPVGIHVIIWSDTLATLERTLDRRSMREFDSRVLFQMSAADSTNLIDSPEANRLGLHRAIFFSEERGLLEKFRPYGPLDVEWLHQIKARLVLRPAP